MRRNVLEAIRVRNKADKTFFFDFYYEKMAYKVLYSLKKYREKRDGIKQNKFKA